VPAGHGETAMAASTDRRSLYVVDQADNAVSQYDVAADGTLTPKTPATVATGGAPFGIAVAPDGRHAYVANQQDDTVSIYDVAPGGPLTPSATVATGDGPIGVTIAPDGDSAYVTDFTAGAISQYDVAADGSLTPKSPATVDGVPSPAGMTLSPDGRDAYVTDETLAGTVSQFSVAADGTLAPKSPATVAAGVQPAGIVATGGGVYVANFGSNSISQYDVAAGGGLSPKAAAAVPTATKPFGLALSTDRQSLYAAAFGEAAIAQFDVGAGGALAPKSPATVAASFSPLGLAFVRADDTVAPIIDIRTPADGATYPLGTLVRADYACADTGGSGLVSCSGTVADGGLLDTGRLGAHALTVTARDGDGNETVLTRRYKVAFGFSRFTDDADARGVKAGNRVNVRFSLDGFHGLDVLATGAPASAQVECDSPDVPVGDATATTGRLRFKHGRYRYSWQTDARWAGTCRSFALTLADGSEHDLVVHFRPGRSRH
jgi:YVTN family beta-propeller protein